MLALAFAMAGLGFPGCGDDPTLERVPVTLRVAVPETTPEDARIYVQLAGEAASISASELELQRAHPKVYATTLELPRGYVMTYAFVRDDVAETDASRAPEAPRTLVADANKTLDLVVDAWADTPPGLRSRRGNVRTLEIPAFLGGRRVWVYLPPGYNDDLGARYAVLYMLDGQNLFDVATAFAGEWRVDEALETMIPLGEVEPLIVVGIDNGGRERIPEYTPWPDDRYGGGGGEAHLQAIVDVLKPYIDTQYRTRPASASTGFAGSSLGGLMTMYAAFNAFDTFGQIAALSPSIWFAERAVLRDVQSRPQPPVHIWTDMGTAEGAGSVDDLRALGDALVNVGFVEGDDLRVVEVPGGQHNEAAWADRLPEILRFLFPASD